MVLGWKNFKHCYAFQLFLALNLNVVYLQTAHDVIYDMSVIDNRPICSIMAQYFEYIGSADHMVLYGFAVTQFLYGSISVVK